VHGISDVGHTVVCQSGDIHFPERVDLLVSCIGFAGDVDLAAVTKVASSAICPAMSLSTVGHLQRKGVHEVLEKSKELGGSLNFILRGTITADMAETSTCRLFNPDNVGQVRPCPVVLHRQVGTVLPQEWAILLKEAFKTRTARSTIEPDQDLVASEFVGRRNEPKVQLGRIRLVGDWQQTGVGLANVEVDIGDCSPINGKLGGVGVLRQNESLVLAAI